MRAQSTISILVGFLFVLLCNCQGQHYLGSDRFNEAPRGGEYFEFILREPIEMRIKQNEVRTFNEPGWRIHDSRNRDVVVSVDIPPPMRAGTIGRHEVKYYAYLKGEEDGSPIAEASRFFTVEQIDQCALGLAQCSKFADCINTETDYHCKCKPGFRGDGRECTNIDECAENTHDCHQFAKCYDRHGSYDCKCIDGYEGDGKLCVDIDECQLGIDNCDKNADCINTPGSYRCECRDGYEGNGKVCTPINKCERGEHDCSEHADCLVTANGYRCICRRGWDGDGRVCVDVNECLEPHLYCPEHSTCHNLEGSYHCQCDSGFEMRHVNGRDVCEDIDECARGYADCSPHATCYNSPGSYHCQCNPPYEGDGRKCENKHGSKFSLNGDRVMNIDQFSEYSEPGLEFIDDRTDITFLIDIPSELEGIARICGSFDIGYTAIDKESPTKSKETLTRTVNVIETNQCNLPPQHPYHHRCHPFATCHHQRGQCTYTCKCMDGYTGSGIGPNGCVDAVPPIIPYNGPEPYEIYECIVCGEVRASPELEKPIIHEAYDITPHERVDVSDTLKLRVEKTDPTGACVTHVYIANDQAGNVAERRLLVCKRTEDIRTIIMEMQTLYNWQIFTIKTVGYLTFVALLILLVWEFGYRLAACCRVLFAKGRPTSSDHDIAYALWFRILHPFATTHSIAKMVREHWNDGNEFMDDEDDSEDEGEYYEDDEDEEDDEE